MSNKAAGRVIDEAISCYHTGKKFNGRLTSEFRSKLEAYKNDPCNNSVLPGSIQKFMEFRIDGNYFCGFVDQIRRDKTGRLSIWDVKYSDLPPKKLIQVYISQLLIYSYGLKIPVGGIVNIKNYLTMRPVFVAVDYMPNSIDILGLNHLLFTI